jgi:hypothetical protein
MKELSRARSLSTLGEIPCRHLSAALTLRPSSKRCSLLAVALSRSGMPFPPALAIENALAYAPLFIKDRILVASPAAAAPFKPSH